MPNRSTPDESDCGGRWAHTVVQQAAELYVTTVAPRCRRTGTVALDEAHGRLVLDGRRRAVALATARAHRCGRLDAVEADSGAPPPTASAKSPTSALSMETYGTTELLGELAETERSLVHADKYVRRLVAVGAELAAGDGELAPALPALERDMVKCVRTVHSVRLALERRHGEETAAVADTLAGGMRYYGTDDTAACATRSAAATAVAKTASSATATATATGASSTWLNSPLMEALIDANAMLGSRRPPVDPVDIWAAVQRIARSRYGAHACHVVTPPAPLDTLSWTP